MPDILPDEQVFVYLGTMDHTRQSMLTMWYTVGDLDHMISAWLVEELGTEFSHTVAILYLLPIKTEYQGSHELPWFHVCGHTSLLENLSIWPHWERTTRNVCLISPGPCPLCMGNKSSSHYYGALCEIFSLLGFPFLILLILPTLLLPLGNTSLHKPLACSFRVSEINNAS